MCIHLLRSCLPFLLAIGIAGAVEPAPQLANADLSLRNADEFVGWTRLGLCVPDGKAARLECASADAACGLMQTVRCDPPILLPFTASARARSQDVGTGGDFAVWLDLIHADGSPSWGHVAGFKRGTHDWQEVSIDLVPTKPVAEIRFHLLLRHTTGKAWVAEPSLHRTPLGFTRVRAIRGLWGPDSLTVRAQTNMPATVDIGGLSGVATSQPSGEWCIDEPQTSLGGPIVLTARTVADPDNTARTRVEIEQAAADRVIEWRAWLEPVTTRVFVGAVPLPHPPAEVLLDAARDAHAAVQLVVAVSPHGRRRIVDVAAGDLTGPSGSIPAQLWQRFRVGFIRNEQPARHPALEHEGPTWWPDPLLVWRKLAIPAGQARSAVLSIRVPADQPAGDYRGRISVADEEGRVSILPLHLRVHAFTLPRRPRIKTAFALMDGFLEKVYGHVSPQLRRAYTEFVLDHRLNPDDISRTRLPDLDELSFARDRGLNAFNVLNLVPEPQAGATWVCFAPTEAYTPQFRQRLIDRLDAFVPELEKRGLLDYAYVYGFDERGEEYLPIMREYFGLIKTRYPRLRTLSTCWPPAGTDPATLNIDWYCPLSHKYDSVLADQVRSRGGEMWWYICMGPTWPYANWLFEYPLVEARLIWWQTWLEKVDGFLYWGLNIWDRPRNAAPVPDDCDVMLDWSVTPFEPLHGDGVLLYPGQHGPLGSLRLLSIRDGMEDAMLLDLVERSVGRDRVERLVRRVTPEMTDFTRDPAVLQAARREILSLLSSGRSAETSP